jgi:mannose-6-phosphate isomerase
MKGSTEGSCIILTALSGEVQVRYGSVLGCSLSLARGQTMVLPAALGDYRIEGEGVLMFSYVPEPGDEAWQAWEEKNRDAVPVEE